MKIQKLIAIALTLMLSSTTVLADECTQTCKSEHQECKNTAESDTAKQACEDDLQQCMNDCK